MRLKNPKYGRIPYRLDGQFDYSQPNACLRTCVFYLVGACEAAYILLAYMLRSSPYPLLIYSFLVGEEAYEALDLWR